MSDSDPLTVKLGTSWGWDVKIRDDQGAAYTPTAATWRMWDASGDIMLELTLNNGITTSNVDGAIIAHLDVPVARQTGVLADVYEHALHTTAANGAVDEQSHGFITVLGEAGFPS